MERRLYVVGTVRTNNFNDPEMMEKISGIWGQLGALDLPEDAEICGIYHNYESDFKGDYDFTVAVTFPVSMEKMDLPTEKREKFPVDANEENGIVKTWEKIWQSDLKRKYTFDFEKYNLDGTVDIYIAVE
jgi:Uncharacterized protein conserved in bacteria